MQIIHNIKLTKGCHCKSE